MSKKQFTFDVPYTMYDRFVVEADSINDATATLWYEIGPGSNPAAIDRLRPTDINVNGDDDPIYQLDRFFKGEMVTVTEAFAEVTA